jgi:hypothetical protein
MSFPNFTAHRNSALNAVQSSGKNYSTTPSALPHGLFHCRVTGLLVGGVSNAIMIRPRIASFRLSDVMSGGPKLFERLGWLGVKGRRHDVEFRQAHVDLAAQGQHRHGLIAKV